MLAQQQAQAHHSHPPTPPETIRSHSPSPTLTQSPTLDDRDEHADEQREEALANLMGRPNLARQILSREELGMGRRLSSLSYNHSGSGYRSAGTPAARVGTATVGLGLNRAVHPQQGQRKKWLVLVVPPSLLPHSPPPSQISGFANGYGPTVRFSSGILMPLLSTLPAQISLIAREFSLPSIGGIGIYLSLPPSSSQSRSIETQASPSISRNSGSDYFGDGVEIGGEKPRLTEEVWGILWSGYWEGDEEAKSIAGGLPIAARLEFDIDPRKARWLPSWIASASATAAPRPVSHPLAQYAITRSPIHSHTSSLVLDSAPTRPQLGGLRSLRVGTGVNTCSISTETEESFNDSGFAEPSPQYSHQRANSEDLPETITPHSPTHHLSWPPTPASPDRLPSPDIGERSMSFTPSALGFGPVHLEERAATEKNVRLKALSLGLIERDWNISYKPLWACSGTPTPTPRRASFHNFDQERRTEERVGYPWSLNIYKAVYPSVGEMIYGRMPGERMKLPRKEVADVASSKAREVAEEALRTVKQGTASELVIPSQEFGKAFGRYPFIHLYPSLYLNFNLYPAIAAGNATTKLIKPQQEDTSPIIHIQTLSQYPFFQLYPSHYPSLDIYPSIAAGKIATQPCVIPTLRHVPPPLELEIERETSSPETFSPLSPERLASATLEDRIAGSATFPPARGEFTRQFESRGFARSDYPYTEDRTTQRIGRDYDIEMNSLRDISELSPDIATNNFGELEITYLTYSSGASGEEVEERDSSFNMTVDLDEDPFSEDQDGREYDSSDECDDLSDQDLPVDELEDDNAHELSRKPSYSSLFKPPPSSPAFDFDSLPLLSPSLSYDNIPTPSFSRGHSPWGTPSPTLNADELSRSSGILSNALGLEEEEVKSPTLEMVKAYEAEEGETSDEDAEGFGPMIQEDTTRSTLRRSQRRIDTSSPHPVLFTFPNPGASDDLAAAVGQFIIEAQTQSIDRRGRFCIALSGGSMVEILTSALVGDERVNWDKWEVFFTDERLVPLNHPDSTFRAYSDSLFSQVPIPAWHIHSIKSISDLGDAQVPEALGEEIAEDYETQLVASFPDVNGPGLVPGPPRFDLVLLGMGPDGHTASLFPGHPLLRETDWWIAYLTDSPKPPIGRITFTLPLLSAARRLAFVCTGSAKQKALRNALDATVAKESNEKVPAGRITLTGHSVVWFVDEDAAGSVEYPKSQFWDDE